MTGPQVHDLIRIDPAIAARWSAPGWVSAALHQAPWVVVRRACAPTGIPVGVRGGTRAQRFASSIEPADMREVLRPMQLVERITAQAPAACRLAIAAHAVGVAARALGVRWGPVGAYGFELAGGTSATHPGSDLDIAIDGNTACGALDEFAARCTLIETTTGVRIDADVLFDHGGIALAELVSGAQVVLAKTPWGPRLVPAPR